MSYWRELKITLTDYMNFIDSITEGFQVREIFGSAIVNATEIFRANPIVFVSLLFLPMTLAMSLVRNRKSKTPEKPEQAFYLENR
jgi:hypothetical protein